MKKRMTALLVAMMTVLAATPVYADEIDIDEILQLQDISIENEAVAEEPAMDGLSAEAADEDPEVYDASEYDDIDPDMNVTLFEPEAAVTGDAESSAKSEKVDQVINSYISRKGNAESRSHYLTGFTKKPKSFRYKSSIGSVEIVKYPKDMYAIKFTFKKKVKKSATVSFKYDGYRYTVKYNNYKTPYVKAAKNIKVGRIRLSGFDKNFYWRERPTSGYLEVDPCKGWEVYKIFKCNVFDGKNKSYVSNYHKITLNKYQMLSIGLKNKKTNKVVWYRYRAIT